MTESTQAVPQALSASVGHAAAKGVTLKTLTFATGVAIFGLGTGSVIAGGALSAITTVSSYALYVGNEYIWDYYWPNTNLSANQEAFKATTSLSRTTAKYLTFKPVVTATNVGLIYMYTGAAAVTAATGTAIFVTYPLIFYINNVGWDWYDWANGPAPRP